MFKSILNILQPYIDAMKPFAWAVAEAELALVIQNLQLVQAELKAKSEK